MIGYSVLCCLKKSYILFLGASWGRLVAFLIGKFGITIAFTVLYVFTTELFPTPLRHSLLGTCSMFGRTGSMIAPQTPLLVRKKYLSNFYITNITFMLSKLHTYKNIMLIFF